MIQRLSLIISMLYWFILLFHANYAHKSNYNFIPHKKAAAQYNYCLEPKYELVEPTAVPTQEYNALKSIYYATGGEQWTIYNQPGNSWNFTSPLLNNPCKDEWVGIYCCVNTTTNSTTITRLDLYTLNLIGTLPPVISNLTNLISLGIFENFGLYGSISEDISQLKYLQELFLDTNSLSGSILPNSFFIKNNFENLLYLQLETNHLNGTISSQIGNLQNLFQLNLAGNQFSKSLPHELTQLKRLEYLSMDHNKFTGTIPYNIGNLKNLTTLFLHSNFFTGNIPESIGELYYLQHLYLSQNLLNGSIPDSLGNIYNLMELILTDNKLKGSIPSSIGSLFRLHTFFLDRNYLTGSIPLSIGNMTNLNQINFAHNLLSGSLPNTIGNLTVLYGLNISDNHLDGSIPLELFNCTSLQWLFLENNWLSRSIPIEFQQLKGVTQIYLNDNLFSGNINALVQHLATYTLNSFLDLHNNYFSGSIPSSIDSLIELQFLDFSNNHFSNCMPNISQLTVLQYFNLSNNMISGTLPSSIGLLPSLRSIDFSSNNLMGSIPIELNSILKLEILMLQNNLLTGKLDNFINATNQKVITHIDLSNNEFIGNIPLSPFKTSQLSTFAVVKNCFSGSIPSMICNAVNLTVLAFDGLSTADKCQARTFAFIGKSTYHTGPFGIYGSIPSCLFSMPKLSILHLSGNRLTSSLPSNLEINLQLQDLSLSHNLLTNTIPMIIQTRNWNNLDLSFNKFIGTLVPEFHSIDSNASVHLELNRLSGIIPKSMREAKVISVLSGNMFECSYFNEHSLPVNDPDESNYQCGSDSWEISSFIWPILAIIIIISFVIIRIWNNYNSKSQKLLLNCFESFSFSPPSQWMDIYNQSTDDWISYKSSIFSQFGYLMKSIRLNLSKLTLLILIIYIPSYSIMKLYYRSYRYQYVWTASLAFITGIIPAIISYVLLVGKENIIIYYGKILGNRQFWNECIQSFGKIVANLIIVLIINGAYVFATIYLNLMAVVLAGIGLAVFKATWNNFIVIKFFQNDSARLLIIVILLNNIIIPLMATALIDSRCFYYAIIPPPTVTTSYTYSSCVVSYLITSGVVCENNVSYVNYTSFIPPFAYSYQCASTLMTTYAPIYMYMLLWGAFGKPICLLLIRHIHQKYPNNRILNAILPPLLKKPKGVLSLETLPISNNIIDSHVDAEDLNEQLKSFISNDNTTPSITSRNYSSTIPNNKSNNNTQPLFRSNVFMLTLLQYVSILITVGVVFPPLSVFALLAILLETYSLQLQISSFITQAKELLDNYSISHYEDILSSEMSEVLQTIDEVFFPLICAMSLFYSFFILDIYGNEAGYKQAIWLAGVMAGTPLGLLFINIIWNYCFKRNMIMSSKIKQLFVHLLPKKNRNEISNNNNNIGESETENHLLIVE
eukprot:gene12074-16159_t